MSTLAIVTGIIIISNIVSFALGAAFGYNKAKHPEKVAAQQDRVLAEVKSIFKHKP